MKKQNKNTLENIFGILKGKKNTLKKIRAKAWSRKKDFKDIEKK